MQGRGLVTYPRPHIYIELPEVVGHAARAWLLVDGEYREITSMLSFVAIEGEVGKPTSARMTFPFACTGKPPEVFS